MSIAEYVTSPLLLKSEDVVQELTEFSEAEDLDYLSLCRICTTGAPAMLSSEPGSVVRVLQSSPTAASLRLMIHGQDLAYTTLPSPLLETLSTVIKAVNSVEGSAFNTRLYKKLCHDMGSLQETLLLHTAVRWLS
ncbi:protein FAM200C-like [Panulirus ornatus]|uniref:protein FAM200C-like n=1 Tax=Panulirus ornatus TaxID=150431 RepID=UPI003A8B9A48